MYVINKERNDSRFFEIWKIKFQKKQKKFLTRYKMYGILNKSDGERHMVV
jgi:hypothetical protein